MGGLALNAAFLGAYFLLAYDGGDGGGGGGGYDGAPAHQHALCLRLGAPHGSRPQEHRWSGQSVTIQAHSDGERVEWLAHLRCQPSLLLFPGVRVRPCRIVIVGSEVLKGLKWWECGSVAFPPCNPTVLRQFNSTRA